MRAAIQHVHTADKELTKLRFEVVRSEQRIQTAQRILQQAAEALASEQQRLVSPPLAAAMNPRRLVGQPLKASGELSARVQETLGLGTKKEAEIVLGAVIDALEYCLLRNLGSEGFSLKLGGFGKFKVSHLKPATRRVGFSGETVTTKAKRKVKFVPLGMLRLSENVG